MSILLEDLLETYDANVTGVLHVGAHMGEEALLYQELTKRNGNVWWVEANPHLIQHLQAHRRRYDHKIIPALVTDVDRGQQDFNLANESMASSIYEFGTHKQSSPGVEYIDKLTLQTRTIDSLVKEYGIEDCNLWCLDIQGAELLALKGGRFSIGMADYIYTEVNRDYVYLEEALIGELDEWLTDFHRVATDWSGYGQGDWGDAFYVRKS